LKGQPIPLLVPRRGQQRSELPHRIAPDSVVSGQNMIVGLDGRYECRPGYVPYGGATITERILGGLFFRDVNTSPQFVVGGPTSWYAFDAGTDDWVDITDGADLLTGDPLTPLRFVSFFQGGFVWAVGVNNADTAKRWRPGTATYAEIAGSPPAVDVAVLANRIVFVNTLEAGIRNSARVRWTAEADATTYPALAFFDLSNAGEPILAIRNLSRTTAAIYRTRSIWLISAQPGSDASAFVPDQVATGIDGPVGSASVVEVGRSHYYVGRDAKVYRFDGVEPVSISEPIDRLLDDTISRAQGSIIHGSLFPRKRQIHWWVTRIDETEPQSAFVYDLDTEQWEVEQRFSIGVTASIRGEEQRVGIWDSDDAAWDSDDTSWDSDLSESAIVLLLGTSTGLVVEFGRHHNDAGSSISFDWTLPVNYVGESNQLLSDEVESFFEEVLNPAEGVPTVNVSVRGLFHPLSEPIELFSGSLDLTAAARLITPSDTTAFDTTNLFPGLQVRYSGSTPNSTAVKWGGGTLIVYPERDG
jgi:hypothetical protein